MEAKSPTLSMKTREMIGVEQFSQRREVFDKQDEAYIPLPSPTGLVPSYKEVEPIITSNHGKTTSNFKRNTAGYSSMRENRTEERNYEFRQRKYSDNFTSELNQSDEVDYRRSMTERTRRLSKMRRDFMTSNLHEPSSNTFTRGGMRASMPTNSTSPVLKYKIESPNLYKFPFAEPYSTPTPVRKVMLNLGPAGDVETDGIKEAKDIDAPKYRSFSSGDNHKQIDHQKLFEELVKRYSPQRKPIDWTLPPTKPRVIASMPKSSAADSLDSSSDKKLEDKQGDDDVFVNSSNQVEANVQTNKTNDSEKKPQEIVPNLEIIHNGRESLHESDKNDANKENDSKASQSDLLDEAKDRVPELATLQRQLSKESGKRPPLEKIVDLSIPALIQKMQNEGDDLENHKKPKKVKRKRSFLDKLLGRNKDKYVKE